MVSLPFDRFWRPTAAKSSGDRSWIDTWMDVTTWWVEPATAAANALGIDPEALLVQLVDGVVARFGGRSIELDIDGRPVRASLDALRLRRRGASNELHVDLSDIDADGLPIHYLTAIARSVTLDAGLQPTVAAAGIEVEGRSPLAPLVAWVDERITAWDLSVDADNALVARKGPSKLTFGVEASVTDGVVLLEIRSLRWNRRQVPVPRWLRLERRVPLPMQDGWTMSEAASSGDQVRFRLLGERVEHRINPPSLRDAIRGGTRLRF